jgi:hypothetical protein
VPIPFEVRFILRAAIVRVELFLGSDFGRGTCAALPLKSDSNSERMSQGFNGLVQKSEISHKKALNRAGPANDSIARLSKRHWKAKVWQPDQPGL